MAGGISRRDIQRDVNRLFPVKFRELDRTASGMRVAASRKFWRPRIHINDENHRCESDSLQARDATS